MRLPLSALIGLVLTGTFLFVALFAQWLAPYAITDVSGGQWEAPSAKFWLGTDTIGRDILSRLIYGAQITIFVALASSVLAFSLGAFLGFLAAVKGGWIDQVLSRIVDMVMAVPSLIVALVMLSVLPLNLTVLILVMGILDSTRVFRLSRAVAADIAVMDYVEAAKLRGEKGGWVIFREILPNALSPLVAEFGLRFIFAVLFISTLSFLGLGIQPPLADWGGMVKENKDGLIYGKSAALLPAAAIAALAISVNLVADWILTRTSSLREGAVADPLLKIKGLVIEATSYPPGEPPKNVTLVHGVDLTLQRGKVLGLIGNPVQGSPPSGCRRWPMAAAGCA